MFSFDCNESTLRSFFLIFDFCAAKTDIKASVGMTHSVHWLRLADATPLGLGASFMVFFCQDQSHVSKKVFYDKGDVLSSVVLFLSTYRARHHVRKYFKK